jgi:hypothetical protein
MWLFASSSTPNRITVLFAGTSISWCVYHAEKIVSLEVVNPAQIASQPTARLRVGFLILRRTTR